jgi:hypothetical protein
LKPEISIDDGLIEKVLRELEDELVEKVYSKDMLHSAHARNIISKVNVKKEKEEIKRDITKAFMVSSWTQRIYFVVRSAIMTILGATITLAVFWELGKIDVIEDFILGVSTYVICLGLTRLFDSRIVDLSHSVLGYLGGHTKLRDFMLKYF